VAEVGATRPPHEPGFSLPLCLSCAPAGPVPVKVPRFPGFVGRASRPTVRRTPEFPDPAQ